MMTEDLPQPLARATAFSRYLRQRLAADPALAAWLSESYTRPLRSADMEALVGEVTWSDDVSLKRALRGLRHRVLSCLMVRDLEGLADLDEVTATCTALADLALRVALTWHHADLASIHGEPLDGRGRRQEMIVVGMGKLGGGELNVSSDIDPIFVYPEGGTTSGPRVIDNHEFFTRLGKRLIAALGDSTADGFVFRVDMRLRPYGDSGPLVVSFAGLEQYFYAQAREWERYAWIKARPITGERVDELEELRRPFVFRKYLDFGALAAMRELHRQIRREVSRRDKFDDIKLGPGGIREIEFIAQVFQLIRGGREPALRARSTRAILRQLAVKGLLPPEVAEELDATYVFLRRLEHRLQYVDDRQTQRLPHDKGDRGRLAAAMGYADWEDFEAHLSSLRRRVEGQFEQVFGAPQEDQSAHSLAGLGELPAEAACARLSALGYSDAEGTLERLRLLKAGSRYAALPAANKTAIDGLLPPLVEVASKFPDPDSTLARILVLLEAICRRAPYLRLLSEYPQTLTQVARMLSASRWAAEYLTRQPFLLDELLDPRSLYARLPWQEQRKGLQARLDDLGDDVERQMDEVRHFKQSETFRLLAQDLAGQLTLEHLSDRLSELADVVVDVALGLVWGRLPVRHRSAPAFAVIAYGKLGGRELGYASDLDIVFLYDDPHPDARDVYAKLAMRLNTWLSTVTAAGALYDTDLRLRPDGAAGLLVSSVDAFDDYQRNHAWTWEHQALTRARFCCGDVAVGSHFERIRREILGIRRDIDALRGDILAMRTKVREGHPNPEALFDLKHDPGGLVDVEFSVQYLVLAHAVTHPGLSENLGNIALLLRSAELGLLPEAVATAAADAYRALRRLQHQAHLQGDERARVPITEAAAAADAVRALWRTVFGTATDA